MPRQLRKPGGSARVADVSKGSTTTAPPTAVSSRIFRRYPLAAPSKGTLEYASTRVEEIDANGSDFSDDQAPHKQQWLNEHIEERPIQLKDPHGQQLLSEQVAEHRGQIKLLMHELAKARKMLLAQHERTLAHVERVCVDSVGKMEAAITKLHGEKGQLEEELQRVQSRPDAPRHRPPARAAGQATRPSPVPASTVVEPSGAAPMMVGLATSPFDVDAGEEDGVGIFGGQPLSRPSTRETLEGTKTCTPSSGKKQRGRSIFIDATAMKEKVKEAVMKPEYNVFDYYHSAGFFQLIAKSMAFDYVTLGMVFINTIWIWIDTDYNTSDTLLQAHPVFMVVENLFCVYFTLELFIRFMAFKKKRNCLRDAWFNFDMVLVILMIVETPLMMTVFALWPQSAEATSTGATQFQLVRVAKVMRITKMARMVRLLRAIPELMVLIKSVAAAMRSVIFTLCLLVIVLYLFALFFVQLQRSDLLGVAHRDHFLKVPDAMLFLLLRGILPDMADDIYSFSVTSPLASVIYTFFILVATLTVMNMLTGVLVQTIGAVSDVEREQMAVSWVKVKLLEMLESTGLDEDGNMHISKSEFQKLLLNPKAAKMVQEVGVDVVGLVDFADLIFENDRELTFPDFMEWVLQLRGTNIATVKDIVDLRKFVSLELQDAVHAVLHNMTKDSVTEIRNEVRQAFTDEFVLSSISPRGSFMSSEEI